MKGKGEKIIVGFFYSFSCKEGENRSPGATTLVFAEVRKEEIVS